MGRRPPRLSPHRTGARRTGTKDSNGATSRSKHENAFAMQLAACRIVNPEREYRFAAIVVGWNVSGSNLKPLLRDRLEKAGLRDWRFDFAWPSKKIAFEIDGAPGRGRHTTFCGYTADCEKRNAATRLGWSVYNVTGEQVKSGYAIALAESVLAN